MTANVPSPPTAGCEARALPEPHPERGLQSAGGHDSRPASAPASAVAGATPRRAEARAPHRFRAIEQLQKEPGACPGSLLHPDPTP
jgi:hypothetical protein